MVQQLLVNFWKNDWTMFFIQWHLSITESHEEISFSRYWHEPRNLQVPWWAKKAKRSKVSLLTGFAVLFGSAFNIPSHDWPNRLWKFERQSGQLWVRHTLKSLGKRQASSRMDQIYQEHIMLHVSPVISLLFFKRFLAQKAIFLIDAIGAN